MRARRHAAVIAVTVALTATAAVAWADPDGADPAADPVAIEDRVPVRDTLDMPFGVAIDNRETTGDAARLLAHHADQITAENHMKPDAWYDDEQQFAPNPQVDELMTFAQQNDLTVYGHVLVWHSQVPAWFFTDDDGDPLPADAAGRAVLEQRLHDHIHGIAAYLAEEYGEFGGGNPLVAWDVVNEVVDDGEVYEDGLRRSEWYRILGEDFIDLAFRYADEAFNDVHAAEGSDRPVTLFINDYNTEQAGKQARYHALVQRLLERDVPIDGVGHQFHVGLDTPVDQLRAAFDAFTDLPVTQAVTELDAPTGVPVTEANLVEQGYFYRDVFRLFREYTDTLFCVTVWGLTDGRSWRADSGAPLLFDDDLEPKYAYDGAIDAELPPPPPTAEVFGADVPLDADSPDSPQWDYLPWQEIAAEGSEPAGRFQARWAADVLTLAVEVEETADSIELELDGEVVTIARDGSGDVEAVVAERDDGWVAVAALPVTGAAAGDVHELDVRIVGGPDGSEVVGWAAPARVGVITLIEPLAVTEVAPAAEPPAIDGAVDDGWSDATAIATDTQVEGEGGATAQVRTLWSADSLYVLAEVADPEIDTSGLSPWLQDSVEIFLDAGNERNGGYLPTDMQLRISADNAVSFGTGDAAEQAARVSTATAVVDGGYVVEAAIDLVGTGGPGTLHGLDLQVNDAAGGERTSVRTWADPRGVGYMTTAYWGVAELLASPEAAESTTRLSLSRFLTITGRSVTADVRVASEGDLEGGQVQLRVNGRPVGEPVSLQEDGTARLVVPAARPGIHLVSAEFTGTAGAESSRSGPRLLIVLWW